MSPNIRPNIHPTIRPGIVVKLLIDNKGVSERKTVTLFPGSSISELSNQYFPNLHTKWIYLGHILTEFIPENILPEATIHVYDMCIYVCVFVCRLVQKNEHTKQLAPVEISNIDKIVMHVIFSIFTIFITSLWYRLKTHPQDFSLLSITLLCVFSLILLAALATQYVTAN